MLLPGSVEMPGIRVSADPEIDRYATRLRTLLVRVREAEGDAVFLQLGWGASEVTLRYFSFQN